VEPVKVKDLAEQCADCAEWYHACIGWPAEHPWACADFHRLPDVGAGGRTGQKIPPSRMGGRILPRARPDTAVKVEQPAKPRERRADANPGPRPVYDADGNRRCACGQIIPDKKRCCNACREVRRQRTLDKHHGHIRDAS